LCGSLCPSARRAGAYATIWFYEPGRSINAMAFIPTASTVRVDALQDLDGQHCENTLWYFSAGDSIDVTWMIALGTAINSIFTTFFPPFHPSEWVYRGCVVTDQSSESAPAVNVVTSATPGTNESDMLPGNVSWAIKFSTTGRGRSSRGRNFFCGLPRDQVNNNALDSIFAGSVISAYEQFLIPTLDLDAALVVVSHQLAGAPRSAGLAQPVVAITYTDLTVDSQRRRLPGRGN
jgi:hypothetical protein